MKKFTAPSVRIIRMENQSDILASSPAEPTTQTETYEVDNEHSVSVSMWD